MKITCENRRNLSLKYDVFKDIDSSVISSGFKRVMESLRNPKAQITLFETWECDILAISLTMGDTTKFVHKNMGDVSATKIKNAILAAKNLDGLMLMYNYSGEVVAIRKCTNLFEDKVVFKDLIPYSEMTEICSAIGIPFLQPVKVGKAQDIVYDLAKSLVDNSWQNAYILFDDHILSVGKRFTPYILMWKFPGSLVQGFKSWTTSRTQESEKHFWFRLYHMDPKMFKLMEEENYEMPTLVASMNEFVEICTPSAEKG